MSAIKVIDQLGHGQLRVGLCYTRTEKPKTSAWSGKVKNQDGILQAYLCDECHRVIFYADVGAKS